MNEEPRAGCLVIGDDPSSVRVSGEGEAGSVCPVRRIRDAAVAVVVGCLVLGHRPAGAVQVKGPIGPLSINGYLEGGMIFRTDRGSPQQHPDGIADLQVTADPHRAVRLFLETRMLFGGTPLHADGFSGCRNSPGARSTGSVPPGRWLEPSPHGTPGRRQRLPDVPQRCRKADREKFWAVLLDGRNCVIAVDVVAVGSLTAARRRSACSTFIQAPPGSSIFPR